MNKVYEKEIRDKISLEVSWRNPSKVSMDQILQGAEVSNKMKEQYLQQANKMIEKKLIYNGFQILTIDENKEYSFEKAPEKYLLLDSLKSEYNHLKNYLFNGRSNHLS